MYTELKGSYIFLTGAINIQYSTFDILANSCNLNLFRNHVVEC